MPFFSKKEKRIHYSKIAKGEKSVKQDSKFSDKEQIAYARGQRDARNEEAVAAAYRQAKAEGRAEEFKANRKAKNEAYKAEKRMSSYATPVKSKKK